MRVDRLIGKFKVLNSSCSNGEAARPSSLYAVGDLCSGGKKLGLSCQTTFAESSGADAHWGSLLQFPNKVPNAAALCPYVAFSPRDLADRENCHARAAAFSNRSKAVRSILPRAKVFYNDAMQYQDQIKAKDSRLRMLRTQINVRQQRQHNRFFSKRDDAVLDASK